MDSAAGTIHQATKLNHPHHQALKGAHSGELTWKAMWYGPPLEGHVDAISPSAAAMHVVQIHTKMRPYRKETGPPSGRPRPRSPATPPQALEQDFSLMPRRIFGSGGLLLENCEGQTQHLHARQSLLETLVNSYVNLASRLTGR